MRIYHDDSPPNPDGTSKEVMVYFGKPGNSVDEEEFGQNRSGIIQSVRACWVAEQSVVSVLRKLVEELGPSDDVGGTAFAVTNYLTLAFHIRLSYAVKFTRWHAIGGDLSDEDTEERFKGFIVWPRPDGPQWVDIDGVPLE